MSDEFEELDDAPLQHEMYEELLADEQGHGYTLEQLHELRTGGFARPPGVTKSEWESPFKLSSRQEMVIYLSSHGYGPKKIAEETGYSLSRVSDILRVPAIRNLISLKQKEIYGDQPKERLRKMSDKALATLDQILDNEQEKSSLKADVAKYVVDQSVGKATQTHEVKGNLLNELILRLDAEKSRDITPDSKKLDKPLDPLEAFVETLPVDQKVGARGKSEE